MPLGLYYASKAQYWEGIPFRKVEVLKVEGEVVTFRTEWPVRELNCKLKDFNERFRKW